MDELIRSNLEQKSALEETVELFLYEAYESLSSSICSDFYSGWYPYIYIGDLVQRVYSETYTEVKIGLIDEAILRGDHELAGLGRDDYTLQAYQGTLSDTAHLEPNFGRKEIEDIILKVLTQKNIAYLDYDEKMQNPIIKEVW
jgi:hypothetical protein